MSQESRGPIEILRDLSRGELSPRQISAETRRSCVEHLLVEGYSPAEAAEILKVSLRTVQRDLAQIREFHAQRARPDQEDQVVGRLMHRSDQTVTRLHKIARDRNTEPAVQVTALYDAWLVECETVSQLQSLGRMPTAAQKLQAHVLHSAQALPSLQEMLAEVEIIEQAQGTSEESKDAIADLPKIKGLLAQALAAEELQKQAREKKDQ